MSTLVFVDPEISTQADGAQSTRVPVPLPKDPYEAIMQAYLVGTDTESEPFEDPVKTEAPESPYIVAPPTSLPDSTPPTLVPILRRTARMVVGVPPAMSLGLSASIAEVAAMSDSAFRKRFMSSYESSPSSSPPNLPSRKHYRGTSKLVEDDEEEEDDEEGGDEEEDEEIEESSNSNSVSEDAEEEGPTAEDEDPTAGDEGLAVGDEGPGMGVESLSLGGDEVIPGGQQRPALVVETALLSERPERVPAFRQPTLTTWIDLEDGIAYIDVTVYLPPAPHVQTPPFMSADSAVTYTSVHSEARSWSIPSEDPYEEAARQLLEQAPRSAKYAPRIRPSHTRAAMRQMRAAAPSTYHSLLPSGTPPLLPIPTPTTSCRADIPEADTPPRKRLLLTTPRPECEVGESSAAAEA
ncbi:hypothetical protein Tco_0369086 [Tanacetum coccineum]